MAFAGSFSSLGKAVETDASAHIDIGVQQACAGWLVHGLIS